MNTRSINWKALLFFLLVTLGVGGGIGALLGGDMRLDGLVKPPFAPPAWLFPIAWTILFVLMAVAAYLVYISCDIDRRGALQLYWLQLAVNALWSFFFFRLEWRLFAFVWLLLLLALAALTAWRFRPISKTAFYLFIPYLLWLVFAGYLNFGFYVLNG